MMAPQKKQSTKYDKGTTPVQDPFSIWRPHCPSAGSFTSTCSQSKNGRKKYCPHGKLVELGKGVEDAKVNAVFTFDISVFLLCVGDERRK